MLLDHNTSVAGFDDSGNLACGGDLQCGEFCDVENCCRSANDCDYISSIDCTSSNALWCDHQCDQHSAVDCRGRHGSTALESPHPKSWARSRILSPYCMASTTASSLKDRLSIWYVLSHSTILFLISYTHSHNPQVLTWRIHSRAREALLTRSTRAKSMMFHICLAMRMR